MLKLKKLGQRIKAYRGQKELRQIDVAVAVGISSGYLSSIEHGQRHPSLKVMEKLSRVLRIPLKTFFE